MLKVDVPVQSEADPVVGLSFARILVDVGPPAAARVWFYRVRQSGALAGEVDVQVGDAVPEELLAAMRDRNAAAQIARSDQRGDRASRFIGRVMAEGWVAALVADLKEGGELGF